MVGVTDWGALSPFLLCSWQRWLPGFQQELIGDPSPACLLLMEEQSVVQQKGATDVTHKQLR